MRHILIIFLILSFGTARAQDYFFEFVEGWIGNYCFSSDNSYLYYGLSNNGNFGEHIYIINELNFTGSEVGQTTFSIDSIISTSEQGGGQAVVSLDEQNFIIAGTIVTNDVQNLGSIVNFNIATNEFELIGSYSGSNNTRFFNISHPNDSTLLVGASLTDFAASPLVSLYNMNLQGEERWRKDIQSCVQCFADPVQILPLSNGNIAYLYEEFEDEFQFTDTQRAIIVIMDGETGDQIGEEILVGDHENYRIWAGGMVEQDGDLLVSYTQPYYYDEDGEWQPNFENSVYFEKYNLFGNLLNSSDLEGDIPNGYTPVTPAVLYRVTQMQELGDGNMILSGTTGGFGMLIKTDSNGNILWYRFYDPPQNANNDSGYWVTRILHVSPTDDGGFMCAGQFMSDPGNVFPEGIQTAIALKVDEYGCLEEDCQVGIEEIEHNSLSIYPNPSSGRFVIELPTYEKSSLKIINAVGEEVLNQDDVTGASYEFDLTNFPKGIYMVLLESEEGVYSSKIIKE